MCLLLYNLDTMHEPVSMQARRHAIAEQANVHDRKLYESKQAQLEHEIEQAQGVLTTSKLELEAAREEKRQKNECEVGICTGHFASGRLHL